MALTGLKDIDLKIFSELDDKDLLNICMVDKKAQNLCNDENFWRNRYVRKYGLEAASYKNPNRKWKDYYLLTLHYDSKYYPFRALIKIVGKQASPDLVPTGGNLDLVKVFISKGAKVSYNYTVSEAVKVDNVEIVDLLLKSIEDWRPGSESVLIEDAAFYGNKNVVAYLIRMNASPVLGLDGTARGGHKELVDFFLDKLPKWDYTGTYGQRRFSDHIYSEIINYAMYKAAQGGHMDLVKYFIEKGAAQLKSAMLGAIKGNHKELIEFLKKSVPLESLGEEGLHSAIQGGNRDLVYFYVMINDEIDWNAALDDAIRFDHKDLVQFFVRKGASYSDDSLRMAIESGSIEVVKFLLDSPDIKPPFESGDYLVYDVVNIMGRTNNEGNISKILDYLLNRNPGQCKRYDWIRLSETAKSWGYKELDESFRKQKEEASRPVCVPSKQRRRRRK